jgi:hypothetical protein
MYLNLWSDFIGYDEEVKTVKSRWEKSQEAVVNIAGDHAYLQQEYGTLSWRRESGENVSTASIAELEKQRDEAETALRAALDEQTRLVGEMLKCYWRIQKPLNDGELTVYVGVYNTRWGREEYPTVGFVPVEDEDVDAVLNEQPTAEEPKE